MVWNEPIDMIPASYVIYKDGTDIIAKACVEGLTNYKGTSAATVIQDAIDALTTGGHIFVKHGIYELGTTGISFPCLASNYSLGMTGEGMSTQFNYTGTGAAITVGENTAKCYQYFFRDFYVLKSSGGGIGTGIWDQYSCYNLYDHIFINNFEKGWLLDGTWHTTERPTNYSAMPILIHGRVHNTKLSVELINRCNAAKLRDMWLSAWSGKPAGSKMIYTHDDTQSDSLEAHGVYGGMVETAFDIDTRAAQITSFWLEDVTNAFVLGSYSKGTSVRGGQYSGLSGTVWNDSGTKNRISHVIGLVAGFPSSENGGTATFSGTGAQTVFNIAHGLFATPKRYIVEAGSADAAEFNFYITVDATNVIVTFLTAPDSGTDNVILRWSAEVS